ncbi:MAG TPA: hypothetical protein EYH22_00960 [Candidatus Nanopusillus sp.]|nr:hypothetical protein [Candidatus Nanopusillus sp.]
MSGDTYLLFIKQKVEEAIEEFNKTFKSKCKLIDISRDEIKVLFSRHICFTCGTYDYFEDMALKIPNKLNKEYGVVMYVQQDDGSYIVYFKPKSKIKAVKRDIRVYLYF